MAYKNIMVHLSAVSDNSASLAVAANLAECVSAHVIGVATFELVPSAYFAAGEYAAKLIAESREMLHKNLDALEAKFRDALKGCSPSCEWRGALEFPTRHLIENARIADLIVVGHKRDLSNVAYSELDVGEVLMAAGKPVLTVPGSADWFDFRSVLVAWKDRRETRRAITDALPLLRKAKDVCVIGVLEGEESEVQIRSELDDVKRWLARHDVLADTRTARAEKTISEAIEFQARDIGAKLTIAGGYGHSRMREWAFGGVTRALLKHDERCAFLSH